MISACRARWQKILTAYFINYLVVCLLAYFVDPSHFALPQLALIMAQISATYLLEDTDTYVNKVVRSILAFWCVFMLLAYAAPVFIGTCIGIAQGLLAQSTPALIGIDLFYPPGWLTFICEKFFNPRNAVEVDKRRRDQEDQEAAAAQQEAS